ncbi:helix-turn-helix transcriptional regulator [Candidatus Clostridium stratigraminis]|uniref:Helix-turn-helix transcriptional regulator n=1 Tax=Candidatus Clostridium stratigraminis TaxID=3381661 RepID=A0ABW8SZN4_9CLOT
MKNNVRKYLYKRIELGNYTVDDFLEDAKVGRTSLFEIMRGKQIPRIDTAARIANALKEPVQKVFPILGGGEKHD